LSAEDYRPEVWECEVCSYRHTGDDPPIFCPKCASVRKNFVRIGAGDEPPSAEPAQTTSTAETKIERADGYHAVAMLSEIKRAGRRAIQLDGHGLAIFIRGDEVYCLDGLCPHEGGPVAQGELTGGITAAAATRT
jgi:hypothetical protein